MGPILGFQTFTYLIYYILQIVMGFKWLTLMGVIPFLINAYLIFQLDSYIKTIER